MTITMRFCGHFIIFLRTT